MAKQRPIYTKAQHQIVTPAFVEKKIQLHKSIKWTTKDDRDLFIMVSGSVTRYVPKSEHNSQAPMGFFNLQMGHYNKISIHLKQLAQIVVKILFIFLNKKIATDSWIKLQKKMLKRVQYKLQITKTAKGFSVLKN